MILIISGTNREGSLTRRIAGQYKRIISGLTTEPVELIALEDYQDGILHGRMYQASGQNEILSAAQINYFIPSKKWVIISPEYNGSYPGSLKVLLDALSVNRMEETFRDKKVALVGLSSGRAGNWLGMDQLTSILQYLKMNVFYAKPAIRQVESLMSGDELTDQKTLDLLKKHAADFLNF